MPGQAGYDFITYTVHRAPYPAFQGLPTWCFPRRLWRRKFGFIGDYEHCQSFYERYAAFRCAMLMAGVPVDDRFCIKVLDPEQITKALTALPDLPEVFICANDFIAVDAIYTLRRLGKSVSEDVLFCGYDDSPHSRIMTPTLTTVHIHTQIMAIAAMHLLISRIEDPGLNYRIVHTETELIYRDSTGTL